MTMKERLAKAINAIRGDSKIPTLDEKSTRAEVIDPVLERLEWDKFGGDFRTEYSVSSGLVDYALLVSGNPKVFIEAKRPSEDLAGRPEDQLLRYSGIRGVRLAVLTNGLRWWLYLPLEEGDAESRRFCELDISDQDVSETCDRLIEFLARENVHSGTAVEIAERRLKNLHDAKRIGEALPRVWEDLIAGPDNLLVDLINERVKGRSGLEATSERIKGFLEGLGKARPVVMEPVVKPIVSGQDVPRGHDPVGTLEIRPYASKSPRTTIVSFTFCGQPFDVLRGEKALTKLAEEIYRRHPAEFNKVRSLSGWFSSTDRMPKHTPTPIGDSGLSVYTTISTKNSKIKCYELVRLFGYTKEALTFETR